MLKSVNGVMTNVVKLMEECYATGNYKEIRKLTKRNKRQNKRNRMNLRRKVYGKSVKQF